MICQPPVSYEARDVPYYCLEAQGSIVQSAGWNARTYTLRVVEDPNGHPQIMRLTRNHDGRIQDLNDPNIQDAIHELLVDPERWATRIWRPCTGY